MTRKTDQGMPRPWHTSAMAAVSMSRETTPRARSPAMTSTSVSSSSPVHIFPLAVPGPTAEGRYSAPVAASTTTSGRTSVPMGVTSSTAPVMPTTTTLSTPTASSRRSVPRLASLVPIPVTVATTSRRPRLPRWTTTGPICVLRSESLRTRGRSSMGMAQMKAMSG